MKVYSIDDDGIELLKELIKFHMTPFVDEKVKSTMEKIRKSLDNPTDGIENADIKAIKLHDADNIFFSKGKKILFKIELKNEKPETAEK